MIGAALALLAFRGLQLALLTFVAFVIGEQLARFSQADRAAAYLHRAVAALGRKLNRSGRSVATRAYRGIIALFMIELPAVLAGIFLSADHPALEILTAVLMVALLGRGLPIQSLYARWRQAKAGTLPLEADHRLFADTHGLLRHAILTSAEHFSVRVIGSGFWFLIGGPALMLAYLAMAMAAAHYAPRREEDRAFAWASSSLFRLVDTIPRLVATLLLLVAGCAIPRLHPIAALSDAMTAERSWRGLVAELLGISLGGKVQDTYGEREISWRGKGTAQITATHLGSWLLLLSLTTFLWLLLLSGISIPR